MARNDLNLEVCQQPWHRLHWTTTLVLVVVSASLLYANSCRRFLFADSFLTAEVRSFARGWPALFLVQNTTIDQRPPQFASVSTQQRDWHFAKLALDIVVWALLLTSTWFVCQRWRRRSLVWWQFSLRSLIVIPCVTTIVVVVYCFSVNRIEGNWIWEEGDWNGLPRYVVAALLFGIGCTVYMCGWMIWRVAARIRLAAATNWNVP